MALTAPDKALLGIFDRFAYQKEAALQAVAGGTDIWDRIDASGDETFENRVEGPQATALDTAMGVVPMGDIDEMATWLALVSGYATTDLSYAGFDAYLTARRVRLDLRAAQIWQEAFGSGILSIANIGARSDMTAAIPGLNLGSMVGNGSGAGSFTAGTDMSEVTNGPSPIHARVTVKGGTDWAMTVTVKHHTDVGNGAATEDVVITVGASVAAGSKYIMGEQLIASEAAAAQADISVAATAQFAVGQQVLVSQWSGDSPSRLWLQQEIGTIAADGIAENTSITLDANLLHTYTATIRSFVYPLYVGVSDVDDATGDDGTNLDAVTFYPTPERTLKL